MRLTVATNFEPDLIEGIKAYPVHELFGKLPADPLGGGRASYMLSPLSKRRLAAHVREAHENGIRFNYLLNAACLDNREWTRKGQRDIRRLLWSARREARRFPRGRPLEPPTFVERRNWSESPAWDRAARPAGRDGSNARPRHPPPRHLG